MRKLAHIEKIEWISPIEGADRIELVGVLGWQCISQKDEFKVGDKCIYIEIDSIVDKDNPDFAFLEKKHYKIKTMKMRGVLSQGIVFPTSILHSKKDMKIGEDVTDILKITEVEDETPDIRQKEPPSLRRKILSSPLFKRLMRYAWFRKFIKIFPRLRKNNEDGDFPSWIAKTDEVRLQNIPRVLEKYANVPMIVTEKLDGTSATFGLKAKRFGRYDFAVCSRNFRKSANSKGVIPGGVYYEIAARYDIEKVLKKILGQCSATTVVLQGEIIGSSIQKNKYGIKGRDFYAFNLVIDGKRISSLTAKDILDKYGIKWVPILSPSFKLLPTVNEMIKCADGQSILSDTPREGLVIRDQDNKISFKCISNDFLLKHNL
jgi:hypothetical protein